MRVHNQTIFFLEQLQPDWLPQGRKAFYWWSVSLVNTLIGGLDTKIEPVEALTWSWKDIVPKLVVRLGLGLGSWVFGRLVPGQSFPLIDALISGLVLGLFIGLVGGASRKQLTERLILSPNEGIRRSAKNGMFLGLIFGLGGGLSVALSVALISELSAGSLYGLALGLACTLIGWLLFGLAFGLYAVLQHYTLRFWLARFHLFPWKAVPFLEDATARILLRRVGGGYNFTHRLLLDHFADLDTAPPSPSTGVHPVQQTPPP